MDSKVESAVEVIVVLHIKYKLVEAVVRRH